jgi:MoxR-like ATPase
MNIEEKETQFKDATALIQAAQDEVKRYIVGQEEVIEQVMWSIISGGHVLLEGLPGLGKTMLVRSIADVLALSFARIQFTPDLMPTDITGTMVIKGKRNDEENPFSFHKGPLFRNIVLADEINRATPKTQSALLEAMAEKTVTVMGTTMKLEKPFFVLATQNPIELEGTYPLPEAQMDRFMCKLLVGYPTREQLKEIVRRTTGIHETILQNQLTKEQVNEIQLLSKEVIISEEIIDLSVELIDRSHPDRQQAPEKVKQYVHYGSGPRGLQSLISMAKARALSNGRYHVSIGDVKKVVKPVLRHRIVLNFEGDAMDINSDDVIDDIIDSVQEIGVGS